LPQLIILTTAKQKAEQFGCVRNFGQKLSKAKKKIFCIMLGFHFSFHFISFLLFLTTVSNSSSHLFCLFSILHHL